MFREGRLQLVGAPPFDLHDFERQSAHWVTDALRYRRVVLDFRQHHIPLLDEAAKYARLQLRLTQAIVPRPHQLRALDAWEKSLRYGVVSLPTGSGKSILAVLAILKAQRSTLVVVPTLELVRQWRQLLVSSFGISVGQWGGGIHEQEDITVTTYDSAAIYMAEYGDRFGLLICDECHHLPSAVYRQIALQSIAPFRLGLSATPVETTDDLLGPLVHEESITQLEDVLAKYETRVIHVDLNVTERERYEAAKDQFRAFLARHQLKVGGDFQSFIARAMRLPQGAQAMQAYRLQREIFQNAQAKTDVCFRLLMQHRKDRVIVFTNDNHQAYALGRAFYLPVISHLTKDEERREILQAFAAGSLKAIITSKVLNEGVDVPEANIAIVLSGSGAVREHVQRLGRILRHQPGKSSVLYEILAADTQEQKIHKKRSRHDAYRAHR